MGASTMAQPVGIVGLSHLGITWSVGNAALGFPVIAFDSDGTTVETLQKGDLIIPEPGLLEHYAKARGRLQWSKEPQALRECPVVFFAKDVPYDEEGRIDLTDIDRLWETVIPHLAPNVELIFMGQVPVGYTRKLEARIRRMRPDMPFTLVYRVETLTISQAVNDFFHPDRIIVGLSDVHRPLSPPLRAVLVDPFQCPVAVCSYESAELTKSAINIYLANAVTFVNTISDLCEKVGANIHEIVDAMKLDKRFSPYCYWRPGLGFAGGHLERDLMSLAKLADEHGVNARLLQTIVQNSKERYQWLAQAIDRHVFATKAEKPILCVWGLAYKKGTDSLHNAHCLKVFRDFGTRARIRVYDPVAKLPAHLTGIETYADKWAALKEADALVVLTEWDEFHVDSAQPFLRAMRRPLLIDGVHILGATVANDAAVTYIAMGIPRG